ncbi:MAG TPA: DUF58 domain-containing protein [Gammaproteobacteria bacterium]|nr:DUF58 domain-containing protein [Gammaproteobacteria bacterium]
MILSSSKTKADHIGLDIDTKERVEPTLKDLMSLYRPASLLPSWTRSTRAQQTGGYVSALKGRGMDYVESRPYQAGDDFRTLDWRVTARTGRPHTKVFREERERPVYICCDFSPSMFFGTQGVFKSVQAARTAALIAWKAQQSGDRVGGLVFTAGTHHENPPDRGKSGVIRLLKKLVDAGKLAEPAMNETASRSLGKALARLRRIAKPGSLIFMISDFREYNDTCESDLAHLAQHNDVAILFINDPFEAALPSTNGRGKVTNGMSDLEIIFGNDSINQRYTENFSARYERIKKLSSNYRILMSRLTTTDEPLPVVQRLLGLY